MPSFMKVGGSYSSHEMRLSGMSGMGLLISRSLRTYTANIGIWRVSFPMYASIFWVTFSGVPPLFGVGCHDTRFRDAQMIDVT